MDDHDLVRTTALDYFEGWYDGDPKRMDRALHPQLVKRWSGDTGGVSLGRTVDNPEMVGQTSEGSRRNVRTPEYREYLHLVRTPEGWQIVNAFYRMTEGVEA